MIETVQEAQWMLEQGIMADSNCASRGIGYRQALLALQRWQAHPADATPQQLVSIICSHCSDVVVYLAHLSD